ncbi:MAG: nucleotidyltransferase domain-containing protein [Proteobacteria bacterium]|nr:nucleotidyltransferase domain-containing protein [Pseudomonadota bacterium]
MAIVRDRLRRYLPAGTRVWVFGSRATGNARRYSDLDLALQADQPLDWVVLADLAEAMSTSDLPFKVDLVDLRTVEPAFRRLIEADMVPLPERAD